MDIFSVSLEGLPGIDSSIDHRDKPLCLLLVFLILSPEFLLQHFLLEKDTVQKGGKDRNDDDGKADPVIQR